MESDNLRVLRLPAVKAKTGLGRDTIYRGVREGWFPRQIKLTPHGTASGWLERDVDAYIAGRAKAQKPLGRASEVVS